MATEQEGVSPTTAGGASAPIIDLSAFTAAGKALADAYIAQSQARSAFFAGLLGGLPVDRESNAPQEADRSTCPSCWGDLPPDPRDAELEQLRYDLGQSREDARRFAAEIERLNSALRSAQKQIVQFEQQRDEAIDRLTSCGHADRREMKAVLTKVRAALRDPVDSVPDSWATWKTLNQELDKLADVLDVEVRQHDQTKAERDEAREEWKRADAEVTRLKRLVGNEDVPYDGWEDKDRHEAIVRVEEAWQEHLKQRDQIETLTADRDRLRAELDAVGKELARVQLRVATIETMAGDIGKDLKLVGKLANNSGPVCNAGNEDYPELHCKLAAGHWGDHEDPSQGAIWSPDCATPAEPRRWTAGDPVPEVTHGTKVRVFERAGRLHGIGHITWMQKNVDPVKSRFGVALADTANTAVSYGEFEVVSIDGQ